MKLNNTTKRTNKGMTLLELTVVILVLLSLISILFIGARAWKKGSDRAGCIMNIRNVMQAARSHQNMTGVNPNVAVDYDKLVGAGLFLEVAPTCPGGGTYNVLAGGSLTMANPSTDPTAALPFTCNFTDGDHKPTSAAGW